MRALLALAFVVLAWQGAELAQRRLSQHGGYWLVAHEDRVALHAFVRPRQTTLVVLDGLRADFAHESRWHARLSAAGQCWDLDVDKPTVSMPSYVSLSTGLESDRHGVRANGFDDRAVAAESIWEVSRRAGLGVDVFSHLAWWPALFPAGFDHAVEAEDEVDLFALAAASLADLRLVHPLYIDETGHQHGAASPAYARAVQRADDELGAYLDRVDLARDLVVVTADHGHVDAGGHGGMQPEVRRVSVCAAGVGFRAAPVDHHVRLRHLASFLAVRLGVAYPRHGLADEVEAPRLAALAGPEAYLADRRAAWQRQAAALPETGSWPALYAREAARQGWRGLPTALAGLVLLAYAGLRAGHSRRQLATSLVWAVATILVFLGLYHALRGSLDGTSIRSRENWIPFVLTLSTGVVLAASAAHRLIFRARRRTVTDLAGLGFLVVGIDLTQAVTFGWPMGFPVPRVELMFLPFLTAGLLAGTGLATLLFLVEDKVRSSTRKS